MAVGGLADYGNLELSPDREQAAVSVLDPDKRTRDIWMFDLARGVRTRFTLDPTDETDAIWSPDGSHVVFNARPKGYFDLYERDLNGAGSPDVLLSDSQNKTPTSWSKDGQFLLYSTGAFGIGNSDIWVLPMTGDVAARRPVKFLNSPYNEARGRFSPDGRWVAYVSNETGSNEVYVTHFPGPAGKWPISSGGGDYPRWRADGKELFYLARNGTLTAATVNGAGADFDVNGARAVLEIHPGSGGGYPYDISADGQRVIVNTIVEATALPPITLVVNWAAGLHKP
jgi:Tol biopolymer transport system component